MHWDTAIRELASQALHQLAFLDPFYVKDIMMKKLVQSCTHPELHLRHGSILAAGEILNAICQVVEKTQTHLSEYLGNTFVV